MRFHIPAPDCMSTQLCPKMTTCTHLYPTTPHTCLMLRLDLTLSHHGRQARRSTGAAAGRPGGRLARRSAGAADGRRGGRQARWSAGAADGRPGGRQARRPTGEAAGEWGTRGSPRPWFSGLYFHFCLQFFSNFVSYTLLLSYALLQNYSFQHAQTLPDRHIRRP